MDVKLLASLIGLLGIALGAFLSGFGYFWKLREEKNRNIRVVLFHLLEIRHSVKKEYLNPEQLYEDYIAHCIKYISSKGVIDTNIPKEIEEIIKTQVNDLSEVAKTKIDNDFLKPLHSSISELSKTSPILAFKVQGIEKVSSFIKVQNKYVQAFNQIMESEQDEEIKALARQQVNESCTLILDKMIEDINSDIDHVAGECDSKTRLQIQEIIATNERPEHNFDDINQYLEKVYEPYFKEHTVVSEEELTHA